MAKGSSITGLLLLTQIRDEHPNITPYEVANTAFWRTFDRMQDLEDALRDVIELGYALKVARDALEGMVKYSGMRESWQDNNPQYVEAADEAIDVIDAALGQSK